MGVRWTVLGSVGIAVVLLLSSSAQAADEAPDGGSQEPTLMLPAVVPVDDAPDAGAPAPARGDFAEVGAVDAGVGAEAATINGFKLGSAWLHPFVSAAAGYDSAAVGQSDSVAGDLIVRPSLGVELDVDTPGVRVDLHARAGYVLYPGVIDRQSSGLSHVEYDVGLESSFNRGRAVEVRLGAGSRLSDVTTNLALADPALCWLNTIQVAVPIHPGDGTLEVTPRLQLDAETFTALRASGSFGANPVSGMNDLDLVAGLSGRWSFGAHFAAVANATFDHRVYLSTPGVPAELLKATAGVAGLLSTHVSALALVGYGRDFAPGQKASSVIGQAELAWRGEHVGLRGGYLRTITPVPVFGTAGDDRVWAELRAAVGGRLSVSLYGSLDDLSYSPSGFGTARIDFLVSARAGIEYRFSRFFSASFAYRLDLRASNTGQVAGGPPIALVRHEPTLSFTFGWRDLPERLVYQDPAAPEVPPAVEVPRALLWKLTL